jgi:Fur family ferric uptake transcriptional regulator
MISIKNTVEYLRSFGIKVTKSRVAVLAYLTEQMKPVSLSELQEGVGFGINRITLYRILLDFEGKKIIRIFYGLDGQKFIEAKTDIHNNKASISHDTHSDKHLHFQCRECDEVICLEEVSINGLPDGYEIFTDKTMLMGSCDRCK